MTGGCRGRKGEQGGLEGCTQAPALPPLLLPASHDQKWGHSGQLTQPLLREADVCKGTALWRPICTGRPRPSHASLNCAREQRSRSPSPGSGFPWTRSPPLPSCSVQSSGFIINQEEVGKWEWEKGVEMFSCFRGYDLNPFPLCFLNSSYVV